MILAMLAETAATVGNIAIPNTTNNVKFVIEFGMFAWMVVALFRAVLGGPCHHERWQWWCKALQQNSGAAVHVGAVC